MRDTAPQPVRCIGCKTLLWTEAHAGTEFKQTTVTPCAKPDCDRSYVHGWRESPACVVRLIVPKVSEAPTVVHSMKDGSHYMGCPALKGDDCRCGLVDKEIEQGVSVPFGGRSWVRADA